MRAPFLACLLAFASEAAIAQTSAIELEGVAETAAIPRTSDGRPDFSGQWQHAFITTTGRMDGAKSLVVSDAVANAISNGMLKWAYSDAAGAVIDPDFFAAPVSSLLKVDGEWRTSLITSPSDGVQHYTDAGKKMDGDWQKLKFGKADDPE